MHGMFAAVFITKTAKPLFSGLLKKRKTKLVIDNCLSTFSSSIGSPSLVRKIKVQRQPVQSVLQVFDLFKCSLSPALK